jgi:ribosomal protein S4E
MNILEQAESDLEFTLEDTEDGFGVALTFYNSVGDPVTINCQTTDISFFIDPDTGAGVSSRTGEVTARLSTLRSNDIPDPTKNTKIQFKTTSGITFKSKVQQTFYDRKIGVVRMILEALKNG